MTNLYSFADGKWGTELNFYDESEEAARQQYFDKFSRWPDRVITFRKNV